MPDVTLRNATDTSANNAAPSRNYGDARALRLKAGERFAYVFFNRAAPRGSTITAATLRLYHRSDWGGGSRTISVRRISETWKASRLTWNNRPGVIGSTISTTDSGGDDGTLIELDVRTIMQTVSNGSHWYGFRIETDDATARLLHSAQGDSPYRPTLVVAWSDAPEAPTTLSPSGNRAVSLSKPVLRFDFTDELGDTSLAAVQVQIDPAGSFTAPGFDSGWVDADVPELDLAATAYGGLTGGSSTYWRVRVRDGAGLESPWSDVEQFRRVDQPTVTIDNPAASPNDFVTEPTPPILWSVSGGTQKAWQVLLVDSADPTVTLADTGKRTSSETAWTAPGRVLVDEGVQYRVIVRVWDAVDREATPGAPRYASAWRDFDVRPDVTTTPVSELAATPDAAKPTIELTWTRATAPDKFVVRRNGRVVDDDVQPEDAFVSGTSYAFTDDEGRPWHESTWKVQAVVNGKASTSVSVMQTPRQRGIWLIDKGRRLTVWIAGQDGGSWALGEDATVFAPLGGRRIVRRIQSQRGYEGNLAGQLVDQFGTTAQAYEDDLLKMRDQPRRVVTLALGDMSLRVLLGNIVTYPLPSVPPTRAVSFDFWEAR